MPYKFVVEIQKAINKNKNCIKRNRIPNCIKKVKVLTSFKAQKDTVLEEIQLANHKKAVA